MSELTQEYLQACFDYDPGLGVLTWKNRPREHFKSARGWNTFNSQNAGKPAGTVSHGYARAMINGKIYYVHRVIWFLVTGSWPKKYIDHKDHDPLNNRWTNIRSATHQENLKNQSLNSRNKSGIAGVYWNTQKQKWHSSIRATGKNKHLGYFDEKLLAIFSRWQAESLYGYHENHGQEREL